MTNSSLVNYTKLSPHCSKRTGKISKITIHHAAGVVSVEALGNEFSGSREVSANYGIGSDAAIGLFVPEDFRAWTSGNAANDEVAVTIEVSNSVAADPWTVSDAVLNRLIELCADICKRSGIGELKYTGGTDGNLTTHKMFAATVCPGPYLESRLPYVCAEVNRILMEEKPMDETKEAMQWAADNGIIRGYGDGSYGWDDRPTRRQLAIMLYRLYKLIKE